MANDQTLALDGAYGTELRQTPLNVRQFGSLSTTAVEVTTTDDVGLLPAVAGRTYQLWGINLTTKMDDAFGGHLEDSDGTEMMAADCNLQGPFFMHLEVPVDFPVGKGIQFDAVAADTARENYVTLFYTYKD